VTDFFDGSEVVEVFIVVCAAGFEHDSEHNYDGLGSQADGVALHVARPIGMTFGSVSKA
jgi:hypothetical protein